MNITLLVLLLAAMAALIAGRVADIVAAWRTALVLYIISTIAGAALIFLVLFEVLSNAKN